MFGSNFPGKSGGPMFDYPVKEEFTPQCGQIHNFLTKRLLTFFTNIFNQWTFDTQVNQEIDEALRKKFNIQTANTRREVHRVNFDTFTEFDKQDLDNSLKEFFGPNRRLISCECWQDYGYYVNNLHCDDPDYVNNVIIIPITCDPFTGTQFWNRYTNLFQYCIPEFNKAFYLLDSTKIMHGTKYWVPSGFVRQSVYLNFE